MIQNMCFGRATLFSPFTATTVYLLITNVFRNEIFPFQAFNIQKAVLELNILKMSCK